MRFLVQVGIAILQSTWIVPVLAGVALPLSHRYLHARQDQGDADQQFLLRVVPQSGSSTQVIQYVNGDGVVTPSYNAATPFAISPISQLAGWQGSWRYVSSPGDMKSQPFGLSSPAHEIETGFSIDGGDLVWMNDAFDNKMARFCQDAASVTVVFQGALAERCLPITLQPAPLTGAK